VNIRIALALIAFISGIMGFLASFAALIGLSTALAAAALPFLLESCAAAFALWEHLGTIRRRPWMARALGVIILLLAMGIIMLAAGRTMIPSRPHPGVMALFALIALAATGAMAGVLLKARSARLTWSNLWKAGRNDAMNHLAVLVGAGAVFFTRSNIADSAIGGAIAVLVMAQAWQTVASGHTDYEAL
jgi:Co/Zn/Cd efflux system component